MSVGRAPSRPVPERAPASAPERAQEDEAEPGDFGAAGDPAPVQPQVLQTFPATAALLQPAIYRDPAAQIDVVQAGILAPADSIGSQPQASWSYVLRQAAKPFLKEILRAPLKRPVMPPPPRPIEVPPKAPMESPQPSPHPPSPPPPRPPLPPVLPPAHIEGDPATPHEGEEGTPSTPNEAEGAPPNPLIDPNQEIHLRNFEVFLRAEINALLRQGDKRGTFWTVRGTNIYINECLEEFRRNYRKLLPGEFTHGGGGNQDGKLDGEYKKETTKKTPFGDRRPDGTIYYKEGGIWFEIYLQTVTTHKSGTFRSREINAIEALAKITAPELVKGLRKMKPGDSDEDYRREGNRKCKEILDDMVKLRRAEEARQKAEREKAEAKKKTDDKPEDDKQLPDAEDQ